jgi:hypothetical protein
VSTEAETRKEARADAAPPALASSRLPAEPPPAPSRSARIISFARVLALPTMGVALVLYVVLHSPLRDTIAHLFGFTSSDCYPCGGTPGSGRVADSVSAMALIAVAVLAATFMTALLVDLPEERPLAFGLLALAFIVVPASVLGALGSALHTSLLRPPAGPLLVALPAAVTFGFALRQRWRPKRPRVRVPQPHGLLTLLIVLAGGLVLGSAIVSLIHPPTQGDALGYHVPLGVFFWSDGNLTAFLDRSPDIWALAHPGTAELWFGLLRVVGGERLSDLGQLPFALLGACAVGVFTLRLGLRRGAAWLAACAFLVSPLVLLQAGTQANDLMAAALLMATIALASAPVAEWDWRRLALIGLGLGLTGTTKIALLPSVGVLALYVIAAVCWHYRHRGLQAVGTPLLVGVLAFLVVAAPWWSRNLIRFHNPVFPGNLPLLGNGIRLPASDRIDSEFVPSRIAWPLYPLLEPQDDRSGLGALFIVGVVPGLVLAAFRARRQPLAVWATVGLFTLPAWWSFTLHEPRFLLAFFGLAFAFIPWSLMLLPASRRVLGGVALAVAALFSTAVTLEQGLIPFARQPTDRAAFYDRVWGVDPVVSSLPVRDGMLLHTGHGPSFTDYAAYYPLVGDSLRGRRVVVVDASATGRSTASIVETMRREHLRYAYVAVVPSERTRVKALYDPKLFHLVRESGIKVGERTSARRYVYRDVPVSEADATRYLFELR